MVWKTDGTPEALEAAEVPEKPESPFILWAGILGASTGSIFFNTYHDTHSLPSVAVGILAGFLPPFMAATTIHAVKVTGENWVKVCVFLVTVAAMVVSAIGASQLLKPAYFSWGSYLFPFVLDSADLLLLYAIMEHYEKAQAFKKWVKAQAGAHAGTAIPAPGTGTTPPAPAPAPDGAGHQAPAVGTGRATGTGAPAPAAVPTTAGTALTAPQTRALGTGRAVPDGHGTGRLALEPAPAPAAPAAEPAARPAAKGSRARSADPALCKAVVDEIAGRPHPAIEDATQLVDRAQKIVEEFRTRTGERMNNSELGLALHVHKRRVPEIRAQLTEPDATEAGPEDAGQEEETAAGERSA